MFEADIMDMHRKQIPVKANDKSSAKKKQESQSVLEKSTAGGGGSLKDAAGAIDATGSNAFNLTSISTHQANSAAA